MKCCRIEGVLVAAGLILLAFSGLEIARGQTYNCDNKCRERDTFKQELGKVVFCMNYSIPECYGCSLSDSQCWAYLLIGGTCEEDDTMAQLDKTPNCVLLCPLNPQGISEAVFIDADQMYANTGRGPYRCKPGGSK